MEEPKALKFGDVCPVNGLPFVPALVPTEEEYARLTDKENPVVLSRFHDTASKKFREEHGALYLEPHSRYKTRFPLDEVDKKSKKGKDA